LSGEVVLAFDRGSYEERREILGSGRREELMGISCRLSGAKKNVKLIYEDVEDFGRDLRDFA
jgi:hypothetical protein